MLEQRDRPDEFWQGHDLLLDHGAQAGRSSNHGVGYMVSGLSSDPMSFLTTWSEKYNAWAPLEFPVYLAQRFGLVKDIVISNTLFGIEGLPLIASLVQKRGHAVSNTILAMRLYLEDEKRMQHETPIALQRFAYCADLAASKVFTTAEKLQLALSGFSVTELETHHAAHVPLNLLAELQ
jgi:hypothetical protein